MIYNIAQRILPRLKAVRKTGPNRWVAKCPSHNDRRPSLAIRLADDGRLLVHCFAGCSVPDILSAVELNFSDLYPDQADPNLGANSYWRVRLPPKDVLHCIAFEARIAAITASDIAEGHPISEEDTNRATIAACRINNALDFMEDNK